METEMAPRKDNSALTVNDVCEIIRVCKQSGVRRLSFSGLRVSFSGGTPEWPAPEEMNGIQTPAAVAAADKIDQETRAMDDARARDYQMSELALVDPVQYEELMERGELVDVERTAEDEISTS